jgi:hypothetical protein
MDGYIAKPYDPATLKRCLQRVIMVGHCWDEGASNRGLDMKRFLSAALILDFDTWAESAPEKLRAVAGDLFELSRFMKEARDFGILTLDRWASPSASSDRAASIETAVAGLRECLGAAAEALQLTSNGALAAA